MLYRICFSFLYLSGFGFCWVFWMDFCCLSKYKRLLCSLSSPPPLRPRGLCCHRTEAGGITVAFPSDPRTSLMVLGFLFCFGFFPERGKSTVQKGFNLPVDLKYFPLRRAVCILPSCVIFCTVYNKEVCFRFTKWLKSASFLPSVV